MTDSTAARPPWSLTLQEAQASDIPLTLITGETSWPDVDIMAIEEGWVTIRYTVEGERRVYLSDRILPDCPPERTPSPRSSTHCPSADTARLPMMCSIGNDPHHHWLRRGPSRYSRAPILPTCPR